MSSRKSRHFAPAVATDRDVARLSFAAQFLYHRLHSDGVDDQGRFIADLRHVMITCVPYVDEFDDHQVTVCLKEMAAARLVCLYEAPGEVLGQLIHWWRDQTGTYAYPSDLPPPPGWQDSSKFKIRQGQKFAHQESGWPPDRNKGESFLATAPSWMFLGTVQERSQVVPTSKAIQVKAKQNNSGQGSEANALSQTDEPLLDSISLEDQELLRRAKRQGEVKLAEVQRQRDESG